MRQGESEGPVAPTRAPSVERAWLDAVERHWRGLAPAGALPRRRDLDAASLGDALPQAFTLEQVAPGVARIRVAGQRLHEWFGADPRGVPISALFDESSRVTLREALVALFSRPALVDLAVASPRRAFRTPITGRLLLLPLQGDDGTVSRAVGAFGLDLAAPSGSRRFGLPETPAARIETIRPREAAARAPTFPLPAPRPEARVAGFAEGAHPWLRLVVSND